MVQLRDGKAYDAAEPAASGGGVVRSSRRASTATAARGSAARSAAASDAAAPASAPARGRRSTRLQASSTEEAAANGSAPRQLFGAATPSKRTRAATLTPLHTPAAAAADHDDDDDNLSADHNDVASLDQGLQEAAATALPGDEPSPSSMHASKKPRWRAEQLPSSAAKAAAKSRLRREVGTLSIAAASMVLVAAVLIGALLPQFAPQRAVLQASVRASALHANTAVLQPLHARLRHGTAATGAQLAAGRDATAAALLRAHAAAQRQLAAAQLQLGAGLDNLRAQVVALDLQMPGGALTDLLAKAQAMTASASSSPASAATDVLARVLPAGAHWRELAADIAEHMTQPPAQRNHKATGLILGCGSPEDCAAAGAALAALPAALGGTCALDVPCGVLNGETAAAELQATLAPFLRRCPAGLVVLSGVQDLPVRAVPALHNALSEMGGFQHDGAVDGSGATYALLAQQLPAADAANAAAASPDSEAAQVSIKEGLFAALRERLQAHVAATASAHGGSEEEGAAAAEAEWGAISRALTTLHRRVEFAAPVRPVAA